MLSDAEIVCATNKDLLRLFRELERENLLLKILVMSNAQAQSTVEKGDDQVLQAGRDVEDDTNSSAAQWIASILATGAATVDPQQDQIPAKTAGD